MYKLINKLWNYFELFIYSYNKSKDYQMEYIDWIDKLNQTISKETIIKLIKDKEYIFEIEKYESIGLINFMDLKFRYNLLIYWMNFLLIKSEEFKMYNIKNISNWYENLNFIYKNISTKKNQLIEKKKILTCNLIDISYEKNDLKEKKDVFQKYELKINNKIELINKLIDILDFLKSVKLLESLEKLKNSENKEYLTIININKVFEFYQVYKKIKSEITNLELIKNMDSLYCYEFCNFPELINNQISEENCQKTIFRLKNLIKYNKINLIDILEKEKNLFFLSREIKDDILIKKINLIVKKIIHFNNMINDITKRFSDKIDYKNEMKESDNFINNIEKLKIIIIEYKKKINSLKENYSYKLLKKMDINFFETLETNFELFISNVKKDNLLKIPNSDNEYFPKTKMEWIVTSIIGINLWKKNIFCADE